MISLSVVVIHNSIEYDFEKTFKSVESLSAIVNGLELIIVSPQGKLANLKVRTKNFNGPVTFLYDEGIGPFPAMNLGLQKSNGKHVWFLNSGDWISNLKAASEMCTQLILCQKDWAVSPVLINDSQVVWDTPDFKGQRFKSALNSQCHQGTIYNREFIIKLGKFDITSSVSDWVLSTKAANISKPLYFKKPYVTYRGGGMSSKPNYFMWTKDTMRGIYRNEYLVLRKFRACFQVLIGLALYLRHIFYLVLFMGKAPRKLRHKVI